MGWLKGQGQEEARPLSIVEYNALNRYIVFSNEVAHATFIMQGQFSEVYLQCLRHLKNNNLPLHFEAQPILSSYEAFPTLIRSYFGKMQQERYVFSYPKESEQIYQAAQNLRGKLIALNNLRYELARYIKEKKYYYDEQLKTAFQYLQEVALLYQEIDILRKYIYEHAYRYYKRFEPPKGNIVRLLERMRPTIQVARKIEKALRIQNLQAVGGHCKALEAEVVKLENDKYTLLQGIENDESLTSVHRRFNQFLQRAQGVDSLARDYESYGTRRHENKPFVANTYYLNNLLSAWTNRYGEGLIDIFNKIILEEELFLLEELEWSGYFSIEIPKLQKDALNIDALMQEDTPSVSMHGFASNNLIFLVDVSASMNQPYKLEVLKKSINKLVSYLRPEDQISLVIYAQEAEVFMSPISASEIDTIAQKLQRLPIGQRSNADAGLNLAYTLAKKHFIPEGNNRIIWATDGIVRVSGRTSNLIRTNAKRSILLSIFYFDQYEMRQVAYKLRRLSESGLGNYIFVHEDDLEKDLMLETQAIKKSNK